MNIKSEKELYANEFKKVALRFHADLFIWGEELIDKKLIIYPKKLKDSIGYDEVKENLEPCGIVLVDTRKQDFLRCTPATIDVVQGNVYISEDGFNSSWKLLKNSVSKAIWIANKKAESPVEHPEEILVLDHLQRAGSAPIILNDVIKYEARELSKEERYRNSRKQSLLDNPRMLYFYKDGGRYYHDRDCDEIRQIAPEVFVASDSIPDKEICPRCQRKIYLRKACYPNTKQMGICDRILKDHGVPLGKIRHCVMDVEMKFHATTLEELLIEGVEDTWIIKGLGERKLVLWHNNYVKTGPTERYITQGFHRQNVENKSLTQLLTYVENYSFVKHLEKEQQAALVLDEAVIENSEQEGMPELEVQGRISLFDRFRDFMSKWKKRFHSLWE